MGVEALPLCRRHLSDGEPTGRNVLGERRPALVISDFAQLAHRHTSHTALLSLDPTTIGGTSADVERWSPGQASLARSVRVIGPDGRLPLSLIAALSQRVWRS